MKGERMMNFFKSLFASLRGSQDLPEPPEDSQEQDQEPEEEARETPAQAADPTLPQLYSGMKVEVLTPNNNLLYVGTLKLYGGGVLEVRAEEGSQVPQAIYGQEVKLRGFQKNSQAFTLYGNVCRSSSVFWHIEKLKSLQSRDSRGFFRQTADVTGVIIPNMRYRDQEQVPCKILDISASGARILTKKELPEGAMFLLEATIVPDEAPFSITCQILRILEHRRDVEYGCQFVGLPDKEQERLLQAIFVLQRKLLQSRRD